MNRSGETQPDASDLLQLLEVTRKLSQPFELNELLTEVIDAGRKVLRADRGTVFLYDKDTAELYSAVATGVTEIRFSIERGIAGECARTRRIVNVPDCYADPRFNQEIDRQTGYHTRCLIAVPLIGLEDELVGVMQLLNAEKGRFDGGDERIAVLLSASAASAIQRVLLMRERLMRIKLENDLELARNIQLGVLPKRLPAVHGYELASVSRPADQTGGDIYDVAPLVVDAPSGALQAPEDAVARPQSPSQMPAEASSLLLLADATGHGIGAALSVTSMRAMLRMGLRLSNVLDELFRHINNQLVDDLPSNRFVTAFLGVLDSRRHEVRYHAAGQGPLLHYRAADGECRWLGANTIPWGIVSDYDPGASQTLAMREGDVLALLTDGFYEAQNPAGKQLGREPVGRIVARLHSASAQAIVDALLEEVERFTEGEPQADDLTALIVRRKPADVPAPAG